VRARGGYSPSAPATIAPSLTTIFNEKNLMTTSPIAATAGAARQRLASSLAALQQDPNLPAPVLEIASGLARAMGPLFQVERGTGDPGLLFAARAVLQETLGRMQAVDQSVAGVPDATAAIAQSLGMIFASIREHQILDPATQQPVPLSQPPAPAPAQREAPPVLLVQPAAAPVPLVQPAAAPIPLVHHAAPPVAATAAPPVAATAAPMPQRHVETAHHEPLRSVIPDTAAKVPMGPNGLPRIEVELDVHSESTFYTNFLGDIRDHGGIFVATFGALSVSTPCEVVIAFPGSLTAEVRGIVRWKREPKGNSEQTPGLGVEITQASPEAWKLIDRFIKNREPIVHEV